MDQNTKLEVRETPYQKRLAKLRIAWIQLVKALEHEQRMKLPFVLSRSDPVADTIRYHCVSRLNRDMIAKCLINLETVSVEPHAQYPIFGHVL